MANSTRLTRAQQIQDLIRDPERKSIFRMCGEFIYLYIYFRELPRQYLSCHLYKKGKNNIRDYFPWKLLYRLKKPFIDNEVREVLENKLFFDYFYRPFSVGLPKILMYNHRKVFCIKGDSRVVSNLDEFRKILEEIFTAHTEADSVIIKRTYWSYGGDKVFKIFRNQVKDDSELMNELYSTIIKSGYIFQDVVVQHKALDMLNPSCLNTMRIDTFINPDGKIEVISAYIRMSFRNAHVDNITSGGLLVGIDKEKGCLKKEGYANFKDVGTKIFTEHPVTKTVFENYKIPYFNEAKDLVKKAAGLMPGLRLVGWDVAITESGPVLIEGNSDYDNTGNNLSEGGFNTNPIFRKILKEYKYLKKNNIMPSKGH
ncbi:MAG: hypothetical protein GYA41_12295 [Bacteroidales bacterium]|nr:hypothetical protein [Bacteroidales bacterium]